MSDDNDLSVREKLGRIEVLLENNGEDTLRLERRLFGKEGDVGGGIIGEHERQLIRMREWFIRVSTAVIVWSFMTGTGTVSLASVIKLFVK